MDLPLLVLPDPVPVSIWWADMMSRSTRAQALKMWLGPASSTSRPKLRWSFPTIISVSWALLYSAILCPRFITS